MTRPEVLTRLREICLGLPETSEKEAWGSPTFRVKNKMFAMYMDNHHGDGRVAVWCNATLEAREALIDSDSGRFFVPPYMGARGWLGIRLDKRLGWQRIADHVEESYRLSAPRKLVDLLENPETRSGG